MHMKFGVYFNEKHKNQREEYFSRINAVMGHSDIECVQVYGVNEISSLDVLMVFGGDGTILNVASDCAKYGVKIIGINCGHVGFLADFELEQLSKALSIICSGKYNTVKRSMLSITYGNEKFYALNEVVVQRCTSGNAFSNTVSLHAEIDGTTVDNFTADGLIISTPTGSTGYSLSAGGSILTPDLNAFIMTPICPHSLHSRPIVFSDKSTVRVNRTGRQCWLNITIDGKVVKTLDDFDMITVEKADRFVEFISVDGNNFFEKLLIKLNIWSK